MTLENAKMLFAEVIVFGGLFLCVLSLVVLIYGDTTGRGKS